MPVIQRTLHIERPVEDVFHAITAFGRIPEWIPSIERAYISSTGPIGVGTSFVEESSLFGRTIRIVGTVTEYEPSHKLSYIYDDGPLPGRWQYTLTSLHHGTQLDFRFEVMPPKHFLSARNPLVLPLFKRLVLRNLDSFKAWVEETFKSEAVGRLQAT